MVRSSPSGPAEEGVQGNCFNFLFHYTPAATTSIQYAERKTERRRTSDSNSVTRAPAVYSQAEKNQRQNQPSLSPSKLAPLTPERAGRSKAPSSQTPGRGCVHSGTASIPSKVVGVRPSVWRWRYVWFLPLARVWWRLRGARGEGALAGVSVDRALLLVRALISSHTFEPSF
jgi:hypothetical protein